MIFFKRTALCENSCYNIAMEHKLLMVLGPTEVERDILEIASEPQEYMRTDDYTS